MAAGPLTRGTVLAPAELSAACAAGGSFAAVRLRLSALLADPPAVEEVSSRILEEVAMALVGVDVGQLWVVDDPSGFLRWAGAWHRDRAATSAFTADSRRRRLEAGAGLPGAVLGSGRAQALTDVAGEPGDARRTAAAACGLRGIVAFPLLDAGRAVGVMEFLSRGAVPSGPEVIRAGTQVGGDIAGFVARRAADRLMRERYPQLEALEQLKSDVLSLASHELRSPLAVVVGYLELMRDGAFGPPAAGIADIIPVLLTRLGEMNGLVNEMVDTARLDGEDRRTGGDDVDLREVVGEALARVRPLATPVHELSADVPRRPLRVSGDRDRLVTVVANLLRNGIKYSPAGGPVTAVVRRRGGRAQIVVTDRGLGIPAADLPVLFTRFGRAGGTAHIPGLGLGLFLSRQIVRRHGGDITVTSREGEGSAFTVGLPVRSDRPLRVVGEELSRAAAPATGGGRAGRPARPGCSPR